jgi:hypothetical protein
MKPDAPSEYRGDFNPIKTTVPGLDVCEHMPLHAKTAKRFSIIRSIHHTFSDHGGGHKRFLTGRDLFLFLPDHRHEIAAELRRLHGRSAVERAVTIRPKERAPQLASVAIEATDEGARWTIQLHGPAPRVRATRPRRRRLAAADDPGASALSENGSMPAAAS